MKKLFQDPAFRRTALLLAVLVMIVLGVNGASPVQAQDQINDNDPIYGTQEPQTVPELLLNEDNALADSDSTPADLIITDPNTDVRAAIADATNAVASYSDVIPAAAFSADSNTRQWFFGFNSSYIYPTGSETYCGIAPVYLPDGAVVTSFVGYVYDYTDSAAAHVYLYAKPIGNLSSSTTMADIHSSASSTDLQALVDTTIQAATIDNSAYTYHVGVCLGGTDSNLRFYTAQILYDR